MRLPFPPIRQAKRVLLPWAWAACLTLVTVILAAAPAMAQAGTQAPGKPIRVVTTFTIIQDIAQNVAGTAAIVESVTKPGAEIHDYQPTPLDVVKAQSADLVLWNGMNLERWFERFFDNVKGVRSVVVSDGVTPLPIREGPYLDKPIARETGARYGGVLYVDSLSDARGPVPTYLKLLETTVETIAKGFGL